MKKLYFATFHNMPEIKVRKVTKTTKKSVWVKGRRHNRKSNHQAWFDTWEEARNWLIEKVYQDVAIEEQKVNSAFFRLGLLRSARRKIAFIKAMENPEM